MASARELLKSKLLLKVGDVAKSIDEASHVDQVICALHSVVLLLFPIDSSLILGSIDKRYREQVREILLYSLGYFDVSPIISSYDNFEGCWPKGDFS